MKRFWNQKTPVVTLVLGAIVDVTLFIGVTERSPLGYWSPVILLAAIVLSVLNNVRLDRSSVREAERNKDGPT